MSIEIIGKSGKSSANVHPFSIAIKALPGLGSNE
jgi:hypothetical protein